MFDIAAPNLRLEQLNTQQKRTLAWAIVEIRTSRSDAPKEEPLRAFMLPLAEMGLTLPQILDLVRKLPVDWSFDHREVYYDFRLQRWMKILEVPTLDQCLADYVENAPSEAEAWQYLDDRFRAFFQSHRRDWSASPAVTKSETKSLS
jgi:hypothetical protein